MALPGYRSMRPSQGQNDRAPGGAHDRHGPQQGRCRRLDAGTGRALNHSFQSPTRPASHRARRRLLRVPSVSTARIDLRSIPATPRCPGASRRCMRSTDVIPKLPMSPCSAQWPTHRHHPPRQHDPASGPWTPTVHSLLRHLGRSASPARPGSWATATTTEAEILTIEGQIAHRVPTPTRASSRSDSCYGLCTTPRPASSRRLERCVALGLRSDAPDAVISHGDVGPWHVIQRQDRPVGFIDWSLAGPTDRLEEVAASGWWNAQLGFGDDLDQDNGPPRSCCPSWEAAALVPGWLWPSTAERPRLVTPDGRVRGP